MKSVMQTIDIFSFIVFWQVFIVEKNGLFVVISRVHFTRRIVHALPSLKHFAPLKLLLTKQLWLGLF